MGTSAAYLAFRTPVDGPEPFPGHDRDAAATAGWTYIADRIENCDVLEDGLAGIPGPALSALVCDSDYALVTGHLNGEEQWTAYINQHLADALEVPTPDLPSAEDEDLLDRITAWAGRPVDRDRLRQIFATPYTFADDGLLALEQLLGVISPKVRPFGTDQRTDHEISLWAPAGETVPDEVIAEIERAVRGEAFPSDPDENGHRIVFFVPKSADAVPAFAAALRASGLSPATRINGDGWTTLAELGR
ncbi:hypothetical protein [Actinomadura macrotermitis]|uniref:Uncharacterized protein n=1 Tax=Actinomadura macrotermitis TaxID=2585200 RepID=A0A7K0BTA3_9ACTN|nr:hypothetical protein [Actinomadura macrotermitis]MQY04266.1 hypothetical protein [Actinomadura macrotermitis]